MSRAAGGITIREARLEDLVPVRAIEHASFDDPWSDDALLGELLADALRLPLVAEIEGEVAGFLMAWKVADQLHILNIAVHPKIRRGGIATAMLLAGAERARDLGLCEITLEVRRGNGSALAFYRKHGFIEVGVRERYYPDTGEDALIMTCPIAGLAGG